MSLLKGGNLDTETHLEGRQHRDTGRREPFPSQGVRLGADLLSQTLEETNPANTLTFHF